MCARLTETSFYAEQIKPHAERLSEPQKALTRMLRMGADASDLLRLLRDLREAPDASRAAVNKKSQPWCRSRRGTRSDPKHPPQSEASAFKSFVVAVT